MAIISAIPDKSNIAAASIYIRKKWFLPFRRKFYDGRKICIYRKDDQEYVKLECFTNEKFVSYLPINSMHGITNAICQEAGFVPDVVFCASDPEILGRDGRLWNGGWIFA